MKKPYQLFAVCAVGALSFGALHAEPTIKPTAEITAEDTEDETQTVQLKVTGMT